MASMASLIPASASSVARVDSRFASCSCPMRWPTRRKTSASTVIVPSRMVTVINVLPRRALRIEWCMSSPRCSSMPLLLVALVAEGDAVLHAAGERMPVPVQRDQRQAHGHALAVEVEREAALVDESVPVLVGAVEGLARGVFAHALAHHGPALAGATGVLDPDQATLVHETIAVVV